MTKPHNHATAACHCGPLLFIPCGHCDPEQYVNQTRASLDRMPTDVGCGRCQHGLVAVTPAAARVSGRCMVWVHQS